MSRYLYRHREELATAVDVFHWVWVGVMIGGAFISLALPWYRPINFAVMATTILSQVLFMGCPLVTLAEALRSYGERRMYGFKGSFLAAAMERWFGFRPSTVAIVTGGWLLFTFATALFISYLTR